ncbi:MAG: META domain-containing protein [Anaerolineales bacterium]|nr:META domain-containing protein [Anaerolineales bacterium]
MPPVIYYASYRIFGNSINIDVGGTTLEGCPDALGEQENIIIDYLDDAQTFEINGEGQLLLYRADGEALVFVPAE